MNTLDRQLQSAGKSYRARFALGATLVAVVAVVALVALPLAYFTRVAAFEISPPAAAERATVSLAGGAGVALFGRVWTLGGAAVARIDAPGFVSREVAVGPGAGGRIAVAMREADANVRITTAPELAGTQWLLDGVYAATGASFSRALAPGAVEITADHEFYRVASAHVEVAAGQSLTRHLILTPVAGALDIRSEPAGARVFLDGAQRGITPLQIAPVAGGRHELRLALDGYRSVSEQIAVTRRAPDLARDYRLARQQTAARVTVSPPGGVLRVNGVATEAAAVRALAAGQTHELHYAKPGYIAQSRTVKLAAGESAEIAFALAMEMGEVTVKSSPPADIFIDGQAAGATPQTLRLQAVAHEIVLSRPGYRSVKLPVLPTSAAPLLIDEKLLTEREARLAQATAFITAAGIQFKYFDPRRSSGGGRFTMGAPAGEKSRRANEFQRQVELTKPFYVSVTEITEAQFAQFKPAQNAGAGNLPMREVSWADAARFCNWLSARDGLALAYQFDGGQLRGFDASADGYRLLSEAEWEWLARIAGRPAPAKFVWGNAATIPAGSGNLADESAKGAVAQYIPRYNDGFAGAAPVASFAPDAAGLYDMAGNVSEWTHDVYDLQPPEVGQVERNPFGAQHGEARVIKGGNFRTASATGLRSSFREGLLGGRDDVGFRVARYLYGRE